MTVRVIVFEEHLQQLFQCWGGVGVFMTVVLAAVKIQLGYSNNLVLFTCLSSAIQCVAQ